MAIQHSSIGSFHVTCKPCGIEQRARIAVAGEPGSQSQEKILIADELECQCLVFGKRARDQFG